MRLFLGFEFATKFQLQPGLVIELDRQQVNYAVNVLRLKTGAKIEVFDGSGQQAAAELTVINKREAQIKVGELSKTNAESSLQTCLVQGISRGERMDYTIQKATELGVHQIQPVFTEFCEVKLDDKLEKRRAQWQAIAISACEQSGRSLVPEVLVPINLSDYFINFQQANSSQPGLVAARTGLVLDPFSTNKINQLTAPEPGQIIDFLIGPEGGLSAAEVERAQAIGFASVQLGPRILRTETVAPVVLALLQAQFGDF